MTYDDSTKPKAVNVGSSEAQKTTPTDGSRNDTAGITTNSLEPEGPAVPPNDAMKGIKMLNDPRFRIRPMQQVASACVGAMITACFMTPLDVIKTRMQSQQSHSNKCFLYCNGLMDHLFSCGPNSQSGLVNKPSPHFTSTFDALVKISRNEGIISLWSGLGPTLVSALPSTIVYFVAYEQFKTFFAGVHQQHFSASPTEKPTKHNLPIMVPVCSGVTARICAVSFVSPIELVRTKMQSRRLTYTQVLHFVRNIIELQGFRGLWRGLPPTILRDVPFSGIYWPIFEILKGSLTDSITPSFGINFLAGVIAGAVAALVTTPFDVVKTHEQIEFGERVIFTDSPSREIAKKSTFERLVAIYRSSGIRGLFSGYGPRLFKVAPACAIMISTFEYSKSYFFYYNIHQHNADLLISNPNADLVKEEEVD